MRRLIVTADDFGLNARVNRAVELAHEQGRITSASLMVNEPGAAEAVRIARRRPTLHVGLHAVLASGRSALSPEEAPDLVTPQGRFPDPSPILGFRYFVRPALRRLIERELRAQFERFRATGLPLRHVDGHKDLHMHPTVFPIVLRLAQEFGARRIRLLDPENAWHRFLNRRARALLSKTPVETPDRVVGNVPPPGDTLQRWMSSPPTGTTEVYLHLA
jgi:hopanoid biosynthesis associated protein HpnK